MSTIPDPLPKPRAQPCASGLYDCGHRPDQVFECDTCHKEVCWCSGGSDEFPESCADCAQKLITVHVRT